MRTVKMWLVATMAVLAACGDNLGMAEQAVSGPAAVTVTPRAADQLAVSWTAVPSASAYHVLQSEGVGPPAVVASVFDSSGGPPSTSYIATELTRGVLYCYSLVAGFSGDGDSDASAPVCAAVGGAALPPAPVKTIPIAINGPRSGAGPGFQGDAFYVSGPVQSAVFQIAGIPVGSTIVAARVRVRDNASGPTRLNVQLMPSFDGSQQASIATSITSAGTGAAQTLPLSGLSTTIAPLTTYSIYVSNTTGVAQWSVVAIDVDYTPAP